MRRHAKASTAGSTQRQAGRLGRFFRGAVATRGASLEAKGSSAPAARRAMMPAGVFALIALLVFTAPASATKTHIFKETFGSVAQPSFSLPRGVAVDQSSGDVLVIDAGAGTVSRYNPDGTAANFSGLGTNVIDGKGTGNCATVPVDCDQTPQNGLGFSEASESQIAIDNSGAATDGNIYVTQSSPNAINIFSKEGKYLGQLTAAGVTSFSEACGVAVDPSGAVYVGDYTAGIHKFVPAANPPVNADKTADFNSVTEPCTLAAGAGPTAGFLFAATYIGAVSKIDSVTGELKYVVSPGNTTTVSVDPSTGHVYAAKGSEIIELDASGVGSATTSGSFLASTAQGVAVKGSTGDVYITRMGASKAEVFGPLVTAPVVTSGAASAIDKTTATLNGTVNPDGVALSECKFEYGTTTGYGQSASCAESPGSIGSGTSAVPVHADISGLAEGTEYHFRLVAKNADGTVNGTDETFTTLSKPVIAAEWAEGVVLSEATLKAEINPKGFATTYKLEWGTTASYGSSNAESSVGSDNALHKVSNALSGLEPDTTYHYRFVATNSIGTANGPDHTFTTYAPISPDTDCSNQVFRAGTAALLPDCRAYEMVSPVDKNGGDIAWLGGEYPGAAINQSSLDGNKVTYSAATSFGDALSAPYTSQYISSRLPGEGWTTHSINPPSRGGPLTFGFLDREYFAFSQDLSTAWLRPEDGISLAPGADDGHFNLYKRDNLTDSYETLTIGEQESGGVGQVEFEGSTPDGSHAVFSAVPKLTPDASSTPEIAAIPRNLYEWSNGQLRLVGILPDGTPHTGAAHAGTVIRANVAGWGLRWNNLKHAISDDGSRVFWSTDETGTLYLRENADQAQSAINGGGECTEPAKACTFFIAQRPGNGEEPQFWGAMPDGSKAIYSFAGSLGGNDGDLYEFDVDTKTSTLIAPKVNGILGSSNNLSYVYFVSSEVLDTGAVAGKPNLYVYHGGTTSFVATLAVADIEEEAGPISAVPRSHFAAVAADGLHIAFMSFGSLTGYDNTVGGSSAREIFRYDAENDELSCISCSPSGARPSGSGGVPKGGGPGITFPGTVAAWIPPFQSALHQSHLLSEDGSRIFFNSFDALVPRDSNGVQDVYQWEAPGTEGCDEGDPSFSIQNDGCISLISSGESPQESEFLDAGSGGDDVFIRTTSSFAPQDRGLVDVYDARVGGGFPSPSESIPCVGDACQGAAEPPNDATPASAGFRGAGDPLPRKARRSCRHRSRDAGKGKRQVKSKQTKRCKRNNRRAGR